LYNALQETIHPYVHFPFTLLSIGSLMDAMAEAVKSGSIRAVDVSDYSVKQMRKAGARLTQHKIPLAAIAYFPFGTGVLKAPDTSGQGQSKNWMNHVIGGGITRKVPPRS
jgi:hypothetical protein